MNGRGFVSKASVRIIQAVVYLVVNRCDSKIKLILTVNKLCANLFLKVTPNTREHLFYFQNEWNIFTRLFLKNCHFLKC